MQESKELIEKSKIPLIIQTSAVVVIASFLYFLSSSILQMIEEIISIETSNWGWWFRLLALTIAILSIVLTWLRGQGKYYFLENDSLVISDSSIGGKTREKILSIKKMNEIVMYQSLLGKTFGYGTVKVSVHIQAVKEQAILEHVINPQKIVAELKARLQ